MMCVCIHVSCMDILCKYVYGLRRWGVRRESGVSHLCSDVWWRGSGSRMVRGELWRWKYLLHTYVTGGGSAHKQVIMRTLHAYNVLSPSYTSTT